MLPGTTKELVEHLLSKYSIEELAEELDVSKQTIYRLKKGKKTSLKINEKLIQFYFRVESKRRSKNTSILTS
jgi:predicted DNA-binding protein YlxM (UPF0122 family)